MNKSKFSGQTGFSLIEVLITLVVVGFGLISMAKLQGVVQQDTSAAKARTVASHLAEQKIEDLRNFTVLLPVGAAIAYSTIATNAGGSVALASGAVPVANVTYNRTWIVNNYYYTNVNTAPTTVVPVSAPLFPDFKRITVTITWQDADGANQALALNTIISASDPALAGRVLQ